jgi:hypothetical protein
MDELTTKAMQVWFRTKHVERTFYGGDFESAMRNVIALVLSEAGNIEDAPLVEEILEDME